MRTKHYFKAIIATMALAISLPVCGQMPNVITQIDNTNLPGVNQFGAKFTVKTPDSKYYTAYKRGNKTTYIKKQNLMQPMANRAPRLAERDSANVTVIFKYDKETMSEPNVAFYNLKGDLINDYNDDALDTLTLRIPKDTFDIYTAAWAKDGRSIVIKELVPIKQDTTIILDQADATEHIPVIAYNEKGVKLEPVVYRSLDEPPYTEIIRQGNADGNINQYIYLNGYGIVYEMMRMGLGFDEAMGQDSTVHGQGQLCNYQINKLSDRYSLIAAVYLTYEDNGNSEMFAARLRHNCSGDTPMTNDPKDCIVYEETFKPTPLGEETGKYGVGYDASIMFNGTPEDGVSAMMAAPANFGNKVRLHLCAPKEYGTRQDAGDIYVNLAFGDKQVINISTEEIIDEEGNHTTSSDTTIAYAAMYGETFLQNGNTVEYFDQGHDVFGDYSFQIPQDGGDIIEYPGHKTFSAPIDKRNGVYGNSCPILSMMSQNYYVEYFEGKLSSWMPAYIGRLGEVRITDDNFSHLVAQYNDSTVYETDTVGLSDNFSYQWAEEHHPDGEWKLTLTDNNVMVDSILGKNVATITYDQRNDDWTAPTLQMLNFINNDSVVTDRFASLDEGTLQFAGGDFNYIFDAGTYTGYFDCQPMTVKVEYSPYNEDKWADFDVEEDPSLYTMPAFGYFYRGQLSQVKGNSSNGWFDLRITLTDESGNTQQQVVSPAFKIESLTAISSVNADNARTTDGRIYDLQGRAVAHPAHGIYIKDGKKFVVK